MKVPCYLDDDKKTKICDITMGSTPSLDMGFSHGKKYYKVSQVITKKDSFELIIREAK